MDTGRPRHVPPAYTQVLTGPREYVLLRNPLALSLARWGITPSQDAQDLVAYYLEEHGITVELGIFPFAELGALGKARPAVVIRSVRYPRPAYSRGDVDRIAERLKECPWCTGERGLHSEPALMWELREAGRRATST